MKILFVINSLGYGGAERVLSSLSDHLLAQGHKVSIVSFDQTAPVTAPRSPVETLGFSRSSKLKTLLMLPLLSSRLRKHIESSAPDCVISFMDQNNMVTLLAARGIGVPIIVSERVTPQFSSITELPLFLKAAALKLRILLYRRAARVIVQTEQAKQYFLLRGVDNVSVIPNAIKSPPVEYRNEFTALSKPLIVTLSRLTSQKRIDRVIDAFAQLSDRFPEWRLVIAGDGPLRNELEQRAASTTAASKISFLGAVTEPYALLPRADLFILASDFEGFPNALGEAMSMGVCSIATDCPTGPSELIKDGVDGILISLHERHALKNALETCISDPGLRAKLGNNAREITRTFSEDRIYALWQDLIRTIAARA